MVQEKPQRSAVEKKYQCVPGVDLGDHASADQGGGSKALL